MASLRNVYRSVAAVDSVSFEVGSVFCTIGPNGTGRTMATECLEGLRRPYGGSVLVAGLDSMATAAAIDRIVHHSVILEFDVPSYRTNAAQNRLIDRESDWPEWLTWIREGCIRESLRLPAEEVSD